MEPICCWSIGQKIFALKRDMGLWGFLFVSWKFEKILFRFWSKYLFQSQILPLQGIKTKYCNFFLFFNFFLFNFFFLFILYLFFIYYIFFDFLYFLFLFFSPTKNHKRPFQCSLNLKSISKMIQMHLKAQKYSTIRTSKK